MEIFLNKRRNTLFLICLFSFLVACDFDKKSLNQFNENGEKVGEWFYISDLGDTLRKEYYNDDSELIQDHIYSSGRLAVKNIYSSGHIKESTFYYPNRSVKGISHYNSQGQKNGQEINYHDNGEIQSEANYLQDVPVGVFKQYHRNGVLEVFAENVGDGEIEFYDSLGNKKAILLFENFKVVDTLEIVL